MRRKKTSAKTKPKKTGVKRYFFEGLIVLLPITLTVYLIYLMIKATYRMLSFVIDFLPDVLKNIPYINAVTIVAAILIIFLLIVLIGLFTKTFLGRGIGKLIDTIIQKLPGVNFLYKSLKQLFQVFFSFQEQDRFSRSVLIQYPHPGIWSIAFLTGDASKSFSPDKEKKYYTVFMPSTPNPTTGFMMVVPKEDVILLDVPIEEAIKVLMSGGLLKK
jgi:uncharacterized membrane protein